METIYLTDNGLRLSKKANRIVVKKDRQVVDEIPILDLKRVLIFGNNQLTTELLRYLASKGIEVAFLSGRGRFNFRLVPQTSKNIFLRMAQHERYRDDDFRVRFGRAVVGAKIRNQRSFLVRYQRNRPEEDLQPFVEYLRSARQDLAENSSIAEIMGTEGRAAKSYFEAFGRLLPPGFEFAGRQYYPAPDPVNALLSFGYMLLFHEINGTLEGCGFDVFLGYLHSTRYGRASLATDLLEELRSPVADRLVTYLLNKGAIKPEQFSSKEKKGVKMDDAALKTYLANYERFMTAPFQGGAGGKQTSFRQVIREQVLSLEKTVLSNTEYAPFLFSS